VSRAAVLTLDTLRKPLPGTHQ